MRSWRSRSRRKVVEYAAVDRTKLEACCEKSKYIERRSQDVHAIFPEQIYLTKCQILEAPATSHGPLSIFCFVFSFRFPETLPHIICRYSYCRLYFKKAKCHVGCFTFRSCAIPLGTCRRRALYYYYSANLDQAIPVYTRCARLILILT